MRSRRTAFAATITLAPAGFCFDYDIVAARIIRQIAFVYTQEQHSIALRDEFAARADENEVVVIVANDGDQSAGGFISHQLVLIRDAIQSAWSGKTSAAEGNAARGADPQSLSLAHDETAVRPAVVRVIGPDADFDGKKSRSCR